MNFLLFLKAFAAGILLTIPAGPIGVFVIQKTVEKGRAAGFISGLGAASSDATYAFITLFGLGFIIDFIKAYEASIQVVGSAVLVLIGIFMYRANPVKQLHNKNLYKVSLAKEYGTTFLLTFSNPLIVFYFMGMFALVGLFGSGEYPDLFTSFGGYVFGGVTWYFSLTTVVSKLKSKFNIRRLKLLNRIGGSVIIILASISLVYGVIRLFF